MKDKVVVTLIDHKNNQMTDLELDLDITAQELYSGLSEAFGWDAGQMAIENCYLAAENPIALIKGNRKLSYFGLRNGSVLHYIRH